MNAETVFAALETIFAAAVPSIVVAVIMARYNRQQAKRDKESAEIVEARKRESFLHLQLQMATAKLSYAVAMAIKRGSPNGEVEDAIKAYEVANEKYKEFIREQANEHLNH